MESQVALGKVAAAAAYFVHSAAAIRSRAIHSRPDRRAVRFQADALNLQPAVVQRAVAAQQLGNIVDAIDDHVEIAFVVEVADGQAAAGDSFQNAGTGVERYVAKGAVAQVAVKNLALAIAGFGSGITDLRIDVAVAEKNIGPAVIVEVEKSGAPAQEAGIAAETGLERHVVKRVVP